jgi:hypothetical protein
VREPEDVPLAKHGGVARTGRIKGVAFREFATWYATHVSAEHTRSVVLTLAKRHPNVFDPDRPGYGILATRWYEASLVHSFLDQLLASHSKQELDGLTQAAAIDIMRNTINGVYKFLFSTFASPKLYARHANKLWGLHYDTGTASVELRNETEAFARYADWNGHHPVICRLNMSATVPIYAAMGCVNTRWQKLGCVEDGRSACEMLIRWDR